MNSFLGGPTANQIPFLQILLFHPIRQVFANALVLGVNWQFVEEKRAERVIVGVGFCGGSGGQQGFGDLGVDVRVARRFVEEWDGISGEKIKRSL